MSSNLPVKANTETMAKYMERMVPEFEKIFSDNKTAMRFGRLVLSEFHESQALQACSPQSILSCMMNLATLDLDPGGALGLAHFVPFGGVCVLIIDYKGLINIVTRSGVIKKVCARTVHANDEFFVEYGVEEKLIHKPKMTGERGEVTHYYAVSHRNDGTPQFEVMTLEQVNAIRDRSKAWIAYTKKGTTCPWVTHPHEMGRKTVVKRLIKYLPKETLPDTARHVLHKEDEVFYRTLGDGEYRVQDVTDEKLNNLEERAKELRAPAPPTPEATASEAEPSGSGTATPGEAAETQGGGDPASPAREQDPPSAPAEPPKEPEEEKQEEEAPDLRPKFKALVEELYQLTQDKKWTYADIVKLATGMQRAPSMDRIQPSRLPKAIAVLEKMIAKAKENGATKGEEAAETPEPPPTAPQETEDDPTEQFNKQQEIWDMAAELGQEHVVTAAEVLLGAGLKLTNETPLESFSIAELDSALAKMKNGEWKVEE